MGPNSFVGTWSLVSCEVRSEGGQLSYPWGRSPRGYIMYTADGYMSVSTTGTEESAPEGSESGGPRRTYMSYCGRYEVRDGSVIHHIEVSMNPAWEGTSPVRLFEFADNQLFLRSPPVVHQGVQQVASLIWKRV